jgi:ABC-type branched-subunit amino acid transport system substrate-binding protein
VNTLAESLISAGQSGNYTADVIVTQVVPLPDSKATAALEYQAALEKYGAGEKPSYMSFEGYLIAKVLLEGVRKAGRNLDSEGLVNALESLRDLDIGIGAPIHFEAGDHQASHKVWGVAIQPDGKLKPIKLE